MGSWVREGRSKSSSRDRQGQRKFRVPHLTGTPHVPRQEKSLLYTLMPVLTLQETSSHTQQQAQSTTFLGGLVLTGGSGAGVHEHRMQEGRSINVEGKEGNHTSTGTNLSEI